MAAGPAELREAPAAAVGRAPPVVAVGMAALATVLRRVAALR